MGGCGGGGGGFQVSGGWGSVSPPLSSAFVVDASGGGTIFPTSRTCGLSSFFVFQHYVKVLTPLS